MVTTSEEVWQQKSDEQLLAASARLSEYTEPGQRIILAEIQRRRALGWITDADEKQAKDRAEFKAAQLNRTLRAYCRHLWRGEVPLSVTYWVWGVGFTTMLRVLSVVLLMLTKLVSIAPVLALMYLAYLVFISVAIWRSAGRYTGPHIWPVLARASVLIVPLSALALVFSAGQQN
jgi:hypothetical protein